MNRKPTFAEKFLQFINGKGFYVVVLVCVAAIGISGFYLMRSMSGGEDDAAVSGHGQRDRDALGPAQRFGVAPAVPGDSDLGLPIAHAVGQRARRGYGGGRGAVPGARVHPAGGPGLYLAGEGGGPGGFQPGDPGL